jgi:hypothetical protein
LGLLARIFGFAVSFRDAERQATDQRATSGPSCLGNAETIIRMYQWEQKTMKAFEHDSTLSLLCVAAALTFAAPVSSGPHRPVSNGVPGEVAGYSGSAPFAGGGGTGATDESLFGRGAFEGAANVDEGALLFDGVELAGFDGEVAPAEVEYLLSLPAIGESRGQEVILGADTRVRLVTTTRANASMPANIACPHDGSGGGFFISSFAR